MSFTEYQIMKYFLAMLCQNIVPQNEMPQQIKTIQFD